MDLVGPSPPRFDLVGDLNLTYTIIRVSTIIAVNLFTQ